MQQIPFREADSRSAGQQIRAFVELKNPSLRHLRLYDGENSDSGLQSYDILIWLRVTDVSEKTPSPIFSMLLILQGYTAL
jgi:hypothetical protein